MSHRMFRLAAGAVALIGGLAGLFNPAAAQVASTTIAGWALLIMGLLQGRAAWQAQGMRERAGAAVFAAAAVFLGLSLTIGPIGDGTVLRWVLGGLLLVSGAAKIWMGRGLQPQPFFLAVAGAGGVSIVLGSLVLAGLGLGLGVVMSLELVASGGALLLMALKGAPAKGGG